MAFPENAQTIAGLVALVSVALLTVEITMLSKLANKLDLCFFRLPAMERQAIYRVALLIVVVFFVPMGVYTMAGVLDPENVDTYMFALVFVSSFALILAWSVGGLIWLIRGKKKEKGQQKAASVPTFFVAGCILLIIGILSNLFALVGVSAAMLDIRTGIYNVENYNWGRWIMMDAVAFFVSGIWLIGTAYLFERIGRPGADVA